MLNDAVGKLTGNNLNQPAPGVFAHRRHFPKSAARKNRPCRRFLCGTSSSSLSGGARCHLLASYLATVRPRGYPSKGARVFRGVVAFRGGFRWYRRRVRRRRKLEEFGKGWIENAGGDREGCRSKVKWVPGSSVKQNERQSWPKGLRCILSSSFGISTSWKINKIANFCETFDFQRSCNQLMAFACNCYLLLSDVFICHVSHVRHKRTAFRGDLEQSYL